LPSRGGGLADLFYFVMFTNVGQPACPAVAHARQLKEWQMMIKHKPFVPKIFDFCVSKQQKGIFNEDKQQEKNGNNNREKTK